MAVTSVRGNEQTTCTNTNEEKTSSNVHYYLQQQKTPILYTHSSSSSAFHQPYQTLRSNAVRNWTVRRRSSTVPHSLMVVDTSCGHVYLLCTFHRPGASGELFVLRCCRRSEESQRRQCASGGYVVQNGLCAA